jgi:hypothetical protein
MKVREGNAREENEPNSKETSESYCIYMNREKS